MPSLLSDFSHLFCAVVSLLLQLGGVIGAVRKLVTSDAGITDPSYNGRRDHRSQLQRWDDFGAKESQSSSSKDRANDLDIGAWIFFGIWILRFGIYLLISRYVRDCGLVVPGRNCSIRICFKNQRLSIFCADTTSNRFANCPFQS